MKLRKILILALALVITITAVPAFDATAFAKDMPFRIEVDLTNQIVTIYTNDSSRTIVRQMLCSAGMKDATPTGTFTMPPKEESDERKEWYFFGGFGVYAMYASRIFKGIMFHSIPCNQANLATVGKKDLAMFGQPASHGCIRLRWEDAKFIALNCLPGTKVRIYKSGQRDDDIRALLYQSSYSGENGQSYKQFLGIPEEEGVMGRFSRGNDVRDLQLRLRDLGIFNDTVNGDYRGSTVTAVRRAQALLNMEQTGIADLEFQKAIASGSAPADMEVTLREGMSGPAVRNMQQHLGELGMYSGDNDGVFDVDVLSSVKLFQSAYGFETNGVATPLVQKAIYYESGRIKAIFALTDGYTTESLNDVMYFGRVNCEVGLYMRSQPSTKSSAVTSLSNGDVVVALEYGDPWSKVQRGSRVGFVMNKYLKYYKQDIIAMKYTAVNGDNTFTLGYTKENYYNGATLPAEAFYNYLNGGGSLNSYSGMAEYATVATESEEVTLNLREQPSTSSTILAELEQGTKVAVKLHSSEWSMVKYEGQTGYLLNAYLEFWSAPPGALGEDEEEEPVVEATSDEAEIPEREVKESDLQYAVVSAMVGDSAQVYSENSLDADVLGSLKNGVRLTVVESIDGWNKIELQGHVGYMLDEDLQFVQDA